MKVAVTYHRHHVATFLLLKKIPNNEGYLLDNFFEIMAKKVLSKQQDGINRNGLH